MTAKQQRAAAYQARLQQRLARAAEDAGYDELLRVARLNALMETGAAPYDQGMSLRQLATSLAYQQWPEGWPFSVHVDRLGVS